ncbi:hypothetical protein BABINDRAFT_6635 [Babjeviella inositovora NRRL Y-12698]|uniref:ATP synthase subunit d, mitochondrial n=1 Tax=Babjeviella inositovora NRRL Y-12698 TaxID=984486 RepID=A0A1E3QWF1_9ASCO|nr:uncharacterized protein BABINDRAFT_6635 [Babjeviella inositovora NRRL Y-12698]ODQ82019.1 hypothetical protein BABINDRAFT_6635 [Babjeviella inositovora NRRL Y-12698]
MSAVAKSVSSKLDWAKVVSTLGLTGSTAASLTAFKKRNDEAKRSIVELSTQATQVDFAHYKSVLKNQQIASEIESAFAAFKPVTYDVSKQLQTIQEFEAKAVENAQATEAVVAKELADLKKTLSNIEEATPFDQLTVEDVVKAVPQIDDKVAHMVKQGQWSLPGYREKFGNLNVM